MLRARSVLPDSVAVGHGRPPIHGVTRFIGLVSAACVQRDWDAVERAFDGMGPDVAAALAWQVSDFLLQNRMWATAAEAAWHLPREHGRPFEGLLVDRFPARKAPPPAVRTILARQAFMLLRGGLGAAALVARSRQTNAGLASPLADSDLDDLLVWVAKRHLQDERNRSAGVRHAR